MNDDKQTSRLAADLALAVVQSLTRDISHKIDLAGEASKPAAVMTGIAIGIVVHELAYDLVLAALSTVTSEPPTPDQVRKFIDMASSNARANGGHTSENIGSLMRQAGLK